MLLPAREIDVAAHRRFARLSNVFIAIVLLLVSESHARVDNDTAPVGNAHVGLPAEVPLDWTKKSIFMLGGLGAFTLVYAPGFAAAVSKPTDSAPDPANKSLLIPFFGPAIYGAHFLGSMHTNNDGNVPPALNGFFVGFAAFALAVDTVVQIGGATAFVYGLVAPIPKHEHPAPKPQPARGPRMLVARFAIARLPYFLR